jgi:Rrf2 family iron-sulfur cluster assembly transcriptional regulator
VQLSRRVDYALRAAVDLTHESGAGLVQLREIAQRQAIPDKYLEQLLRALKTAGVVVATRGARGGYQLARPADEITVLAIFEAVDGPLAGEEPAPIGGCARTVAALWDDVTGGLRDQLAGLSLAQLAARDRHERSSRDDWVI